MFRDLGMYGQPCRHAVSSLLGVRGSSIVQRLERANLETGFAVYGLGFRV